MAVFAATVWAAAGVANAQVADPPSGPMPMHAETARFVDVVDSFDVGSQFSVRLSAGYQFQRRDLRIQREMRVSNPGTSLGVPQYGDVADYTRSTHTLLVNAEVGLFHDLALTFGLPLVLSDARKLRPASGVSAESARNALADGWSEGTGAAARNTTLFDATFDSPERSGIDQVRLGLQWSIFNQQRDPNRPTWTLSFEWRPPVGSLMRPCRQTTSATFCPNASSVPATPASGTSAPAAAERTAGPANPGLSRGLHGVFFQTAIARRLGYIEPYAGLDFLAEFPVRSSDFAYAETPLGQLSNFPPLVASLTMGTEIIPWENRETWQRLLIDFRFRGSYFSQGRDYSPLYDALGSSLSRPLNLPGCPSNARGPDGTCQAERNVYFNGLTTTASHVVLGGSAMVSIQPAKFLRFTIGAAVAWTSPHTITNTDACNPGTPVPADHPEWRGGCSGNSSPDPTHRPVIDGAGGRFRTTNDLTWDFYAAIALTPRIW